jgi:hypothetical protein
MGVGVFYSYWTDKMFIGQKIKKEGNYIKEKVYWLTLGDMPGNKYN